MSLPFVRRVVCAAVRYPDGSMLVGPRHFDAVMLQQYRSLGLNFQESEAQAGFLDQNGVFMDRKEAMLVALAARQIGPGSTEQSDRLFSEDLY
jgi:hypothetical protein